jgi:beta-galactosidase
MTGFKSHHRRAFNGLALVIVKGRDGQTGSITLSAKSDRLTAAAVTINVK